MWESPNIFSYVLIYLFALGERKQIYQFVEEARTSIAGIIIVNFEAAKKNGRNKNNKQQQRERRHASQSTNHIRIHKAETPKLDQAK